MTVINGCENCGDCSGWKIWQSKDFCTGTIEYIWIPCDLCNPNELKQKPELCKLCHNTPALCVCDSVKDMD